MTPANRIIGRAVEACTTTGFDPQDDPNVRLRKQLLMGITLLEFPAGVLWGTIYLAFNEPLAALMPYTYSLMTTISLLIFRHNRNFAGFRFRQLLLVILLPFLLMIALGGFIPSSAVILWSLIAPIGALIFDEPRRARSWIAGFFILLMIAAVADALKITTSHLPEWLVSLFFILNIGAISGVALTVLYMFVSQKDVLMRQLSVEQQKSENLLLNILPKDIAAILKNSPRTIADHFDEASVMFADMVGFTRLTAELPAVEMLELLNELFSYFDMLVDQYGVEKIRTIGDSYMVVSGVPRPRPDHAHALAHMALDMQAYLLNRPPLGDRRLDFRIGINSGPLIAGVIGRKKFIYDLWGDSVNTASRMESHGSPGKIQISRETYELIRDAFVCEERGVVQVKGKGEMTTYFLLGRRVESSVQPEVPEPLPA